MSHTRSNVVADFSLLPISLSQRMSSFSSSGMGGRSAAVVSSRGATKTAPMVSVVVGCTTRQWSLIVMTAPDSLAMVAWSWVLIH
jgi:hypothetical protein